MKWRRYVARGLALVWAVFWGGFALLSGAGEGISGIVANAPNALPGLGFLIAAIIAWRWEIVGGIILILCGLFAFFFFHIGRNAFLLGTIVFPPILAGSLFLYNGLRSRNSDSP